MVEINVALSVMVWAGGLLVIRAYFPHMYLWRRPDPVSWLARGFVALNAAFIARTIYWDVIWWAMGNMPGDPGVNIWLNLAVIMSQFCALKARLLSIPEAERGRFNVITCAFYPRGLRFLRPARSKRGERDT